MGRVFLSVVLCSTTLLGPMLCCCTVTPVFDAIASKLALTKANSAKPTQKKCCCQHSPAHPEKDKSAPRCPCKQNGGTDQPVTAAASPVAHQLIADSGFSVPAFECCVDRAPQVVANAIFAKDIESSAFPYLTGSDILRALHVMQI